MGARSRHSAQNAGGLGELAGQIFEARVLELCRSGCLPGLAHSRLAVRPAGATRTVVPIDVVFQKNNPRMPRRKV